MSDLMLDVAIRVEPEPIGQESMEHIINCNAPPFCPENYKVIYHGKSSGQMKWVPNCVELFLANGQKNGKYIYGLKLQKELAGRPVLNACVLDWLLTYPDLIPEEWKNKYICFWGTIYHDHLNSLCVRCLCWNGAEWIWKGFRFNDAFRRYCPAALLANII